MDHAIKPRPTLKMRLIEEGMTQRDLARRAGIPESYLSHYIHGRMSLNTVEKARIAQALDMPLTKVFE